MQSGPMMSDGPNPTKRHRVGTTVLVVSIAAVAAGLYCNNEGESGAAGRYIAPPIAEPVIGVIMTSPDGYNNSIHDTFSPETGEQQGGIEQRDPDTLASPRTSFLGQFNPNNQFGNPGGRPGGGGNIPGGGGSTNGGAAGGVWIDPIVRLANEADERTPLMRSAALRSLPSERNRFSD